MSAEFIVFFKTFYNTPPFTFIACAGRTGMFFLIAVSKEIPFHPFASNFQNINFFGQKLNIGLTF